MTWLSKLFGAPASEASLPPGSIAIHPQPASAPLSSARLRTEVAALPRTKYREGYVIADVDAFVDRACRALEERARGHLPGLTHDDVLNMKFKASKFQEGYDQDAVDDLLDRVAVALR